MYVCICYAVTENEVNAEIALGARTLEDIGEQCEAGTGCGTCHDKLDNLLDRAALRRELGCCGSGCGAGCDGFLQRLAADETASSRRSS
jgi:bacterioferritin-associated ferredoxin